MSKQARYFSHDDNARGDERMLILRAKCGWAGYGVFWALVEMMHENESTSLRHDSIEGIALAFNVKAGTLQKIIDVAIDPAHLFESNGSEFWSESLRRRKALAIEKQAKYADAGRKGMATRWGAAEAKPANNAGSTAPSATPNNDVITSLRQRNNEDITIKGNKGNKGNEVKKGKGKTDSPGGESSAPTFESIIVAYTTNEDLRVELREFVKMRDRKKKPLTPHALDLQLRDLTKFAADDPLKIATVQKAIKKTWESVYELTPAEKAEVAAASAPAGGGRKDYTKGWK